MFQLTQAAAHRALKFAIACARPIWFLVSDWEGGTMSEVMRCFSRIRAIQGDMAMWIDAAAGFQKSLAALPLTIYQAGETVLADGSRTDRLLILKKGNVAVVKEGIEIARVTEPGAVFGEISALLDCPHTADVRALATSQFHVAHPAALQDPAALFYVAAILARRLDSANQALVELKSEIQDKPRSVIDKTIKKLERLLGASGANLGLYSGYSYNPLA